LKRGCLVAVVLTATAFVVPALASPSRIAIVVHPPIAGTQAEFESVLRSELLAAGFEVLTVPETASDGATLEAVARRTESMAAVSIVQPPGSLAADVWIGDQLTGKTLLRHVRPERVAPEAPSIVAIRAVELLRASFLELSETRSSRSEMGSVSSAQAWVAPPDPVAIAPNDSRTNAPDTADAKWSIALSGAGIGGPGGLPSGLAPALALSWRASPSWVGQLFALGPALGSVDMSIGSARIDQELVAARARFDIVRSRFAPFLTAGLGAYHLGASGTAPEPYVASSGHAWAAIAMAGTGVRLSLGPPVALVGEVDALLAAPRPVVQFAGQEGLYAGRPTLLGQVGGEVSW
jgi:hypothetical protein